MSDKIDLTVRFSGITKEQAAVLQDMFAYWEHVGAKRSENVVCVLLGGSGSFRPTIDAKASVDLPTSFGQALALCHIDDGHGNREYLPDALGFYLRHPEDLKIAQRQYGGCLVTEGAASVK